MSIESFDDAIYDGGPDGIRSELSRESGIRGFGHVAMAGHDGMSGDVILTIVTLPDYANDLFPGNDPRP